MSEATAAPAGSSALPDDILQSLAIANATAIGGQPAILANLALENQIFNQNLQQQACLAQQQATNLIILAVVAKCVKLIATEAAPGADTKAQLADLLATLKTLTPPASPSAPSA
jgi:hypothetical protein